VEQVADLGRQAGGDLLLSLVAVGKTRPGGCPLTGGQGRTTLGAGSGPRGGDAVVVELEQVVSGGGEAPFRAARRSSAA
jgi:hypothetical protein